MVCVDPVISSVSRDTLDDGLHALKQRSRHVAIMFSGGGEEAGHDILIFPIQPEMELLPFPVTILAMYLHLPFSFPADLEARGIEEKMERAGSSMMQRHLQGSAAQTERGVIGDREIGAHDLKHGVQEGFRLPEGQMEDRAQREGAEDGGITEDKGPAPHPLSSMDPSIKGIIGDPDSERATSGQSIVVFLPVLDAVPCFLHDAGGEDGGCNRPFSPF